MDTFSLTRHGHEASSNPAESKPRSAKKVTDTDESFSLTQKTLPKLPRPRTGNKLYFDVEHRGLAVRVTAAGAISFVLNYRIRGRERRYTIGRFPDLALAGARQEALRLRGEIQKGFDPLERRTSEREAPTITDLAKDYFEFYAEKNKRASSLRNDHQMLDNLILPKLGKFTVAAVTQRDIETLHASLRATPYRANRVLALLSKLFSLAVQWNAQDIVWRTDNPAANVVHFPEEKREVWLREDQLKRLTSALASYPNQDVANVVRLLLLTGARKTEVLSATWSQFDLEQRIWTKPSAHTKQKRTEHVPISQAAHKLLVKMKADAREDFLFPGRIKGDHLKDIKDDWRDICVAAKLDGFRVHDLRHTYASHLVSSGVPLAVVGKLLGHTQSQTTERYAHLAESPLREATNRIGKLMTSKRGTARRDGEP
jgi:integrase